MDPEIDGEELSQRAKRLRARRASTDTNTSLRSRRGSTETNMSVTNTPKKAGRPSKLQKITEKESKTKSKKRETKNTDDDDASSSVSTEKSLKSMRNCKVVLEQIDLDDDEKLLSSVPKTRSRKKSTLTEENLAAFSPSATRRTTRSGSILSEETTSTKAPTLPLRVTRRNSTAAATAPIAVVTPKRDLRSTRASSNSSDDVSVKSRNRRISSPVEPRTPKITKKKGTSRLKSDTSESTEVISNIKSEKKSPEMTEEVEQSQLEPIVEDSFATPTGTAYTERSVISIYDSDEEIDSNIATAEPLEQDQTIEIVSTVTKPIATTSIKTMKQEEMNEDQNETVQVMPTVTTAIAVTETELLSLVKNSDAVKNVSVNTKSRPSISKWPKAKFRDEEEEPMDLSETINEENSVNQSADIFGRIAEVMASAAATTGADSQLSFVMPVDANGSEIMQPSEIPNEVMSVVDEKLVSVCEALTPAKIASPLKKTSQLMSATLSSQQAASPKAKPRTLSKLLDIDQNEDDQNADEVSEAPQTAQKSPKISPSKLDRIAPVVEAIAMTPQETPEPAAASTSSIDVTASEKTAKGATPMAAASTKSKFEISKNPLGIEKSTPPSEESADSMDISSAENAQSIDAQLSENQPNSPAVTVKTITETIQTTLSVTPKPLAEVRTIQTPELAVAENFAQSPELVEEPRYVQTPKMIDDKTASQTPKQMRAAQTPKMERKNTDGEATPQQLSKQLQKRRDTPYPDKTLLSTSAAQASGIVANESAVKTDLDEHLKASRERLKQLSSSYTQSVKRNSLDAPFIDGFGVQNKSATAALGEAPPKKFFAARNRLEDSDSSDHDNDEVEENTPKNEFVEDEAVEAMGYQSGDSMDSEERRDIEDNEHVEDGISLGSQDTDNENEDDDENDSFIASEDEVFDTLLSDEDDFDRLVSKSKYKRVVMESSSDSDNEDETTNVKNKSLVSAILSGSTEPLVDVVETRTETTVTDANKSIQTIVTETTTIEKTESSKTTRRSVQVEPEHKPVDMESSSESDDDEGVSANVESKFVVDAILSGSMRTAVDLVDETASSNVVIAEKTRTETTVTDTNKSIQTIVAESETIETSQLGKTTRRSVQVENTNDSIGDFVVSESLQHSIADESVNKSVNKTGFEETDRLSPEVSSNKLLVGSKKRDVSMSFVEEDATIEKTDTLIQSVGSVAAKFVETENAKTPEMAIEDIKETEIGTHESDDNDEENVQYSLNKSHPKFEEIVASALGGAKSPLVHHDEEAMSSEDEQSPTPTVVETTADKTVTDKSLAEVKAVEHQPSSDCDDDNTFYSFNEAHPANATLLRLMRASPRSAETTKSQPEQIVSTALNTSRGKDAKASKSAEKSLTPRQGKENVSANQVTVAVKTAVNRSLQDNENTSPALAFKTFLKKSANKSFGDIDTSQTLQVNPLSMHFDVNTSSLRRSSTPNQKALLKTQAVAAQSIASKPNDISNVASIELAPIESANRPKSARNSVKSPEIIESTTSPEANNNEKKPHKESSTEVPLKTVNLIDILNRCEAELTETKEKKKKEKSENIEEDERQLEKSEKKKLKKAEKLAARAAAEEKKRQQMEDAEKSAAERKKQKKAKLSLEQDNEQPSTSAALHLASTSAQSKSNGKRSLKKRDESTERDGSVDAEQPKAKKAKHLKILTSSGEFNVVPMTPPRVQFGFVETPLTPTPRGFKVQPIQKNKAESPKPIKNQKRNRVIDLDAPSTSLRKPKWHVESLFDRFEQTHSKKRQRESNEIHIFNSGPTQFIVKSLESVKRRKQPSSSLIPSELMEYRKQNLYRKGIPRQDAHTLLKMKEKIAMSKRS